MEDKNYAELLLTLRSSGDRDVEKCINNQQVKEKNYSVKIIVIYFIFNFNFKLFHFRRILMLVRIAYRLRNQVDLVKQKPFMIQHLN